MKKILFTLIPEKGHINPYIAVAQQLQIKGYEVCFYAQQDISTQLQAANLNCFIGDSTQQSPINFNHAAKFAENINDAKWLRTWIKQLLLDKVATDVPAIIRILEKFKPDIIVTDPMIYATAIAANLQQIKWVAISNSLNPVLNEHIKSELLNTVNWLTPLRADVIKQYAMEIEFSACDMLSPYLNITFSTSELVGETKYPIELVGSSIPKGNRGDECPFPWEKLSQHQPIIYMSLGSQIYYQPVMFKTVFAAVKNRPIQLIATVNELMHSDKLGEIPSNVLLVAYTPQLKLLEKVSVMITHGGANSVMEAIHFNVPMLISPICNDQFHQAYFIEKKNIGIALDLQHAKHEQCWNALSTLLHSVTIKNNMNRVSQSYQHDGAFKAANLVETLLEQEY